MSDALTSNVRALQRAIDALNQTRRVIIGIAGGPASGKSTLARDVVDSINRRDAGAACLVPMDGFHLDNDILEARGLLDRKGAPQTFDSGGFVSMLKRLRQADVDVYAPIFDRSRDIAIAGAQHIPTGSKTVIVEGNYLLLDEEPWRQGRELFDLTVSLDVPLDVLENRLVRRWLDHGIDAQAARARALGNDIPNAKLIAQKSAMADLVVK